MCRVIALYINDGIIKPSTKTYLQTFFLLHSFLRSVQICILGINPNVRHFKNFSNRKVSAAICIPILGPQRPLGASRLLRFPFSSDIFHFGTFGWNLGLLNLKKGFLGVPRDS